MSKEEIENGNKLIAEFMGHLPTVEYCVGKDGSYCYNPSHHKEYFPTPLSQKQECERWLTEQKERFPEGWVTKDGYGVVKIEWFKFYEMKWNDLMDVVEKIESIQDDHHGYFGVHISSNSCTIQATNLRTDKPLANPPHYYSEYIDDTKILATWHAVTAFIQFYNQSKTNKQ